MSQREPDESMLDAYLADELSAEERARVDRRLKKDPELRRKVENFKTFDRALLSALAGPDSEDLALFIEGRLPLDRAHRVKKAIDRDPELQEITDIVGDALEAFESGRLDEVRRSAKSSAKTNETSSDRTSRRDSRSESATRRRRRGTARIKRRPVQRGAPAWLTIGLPAAAAAGLLIFALPGLMRGPTRPDDGGSTAINNPKPDKPTPGDTKPDKPTPGDATPDKPTPGDAKPDKPTPGDSKPDKPTPGDATPDKPTPGDSKPGKPTLGDTTPDRPTPGDATPDKPTPGDTTPDKPTPDKPGDTKVAPVRPTRPITLASVEGSLLVQPGGRGGWVQPEKASPLGADDVLACKSGGAATFRYSGNRVALREGSRVRLAEDDQESRLHLDAGEAYIELDPRRTGRFVAISGQTRSVALGTRFLIRREANGSTLVVVTRGRVRVENARGEVTLAADQSARAGDSAAPKTIATPEGSLAWIESAARASIARSGFVWHEGVLAWRSLSGVTAALDSEDARSRARALFALRAARLAPLTRQAGATGLARLATVERELLGLDTAALIKGGAAGELVLATGFRVIEEGRGKLAAIGKLEKSEDAGDRALAARLIELGQALEGALLARSTPAPAEAVLALRLLDEGGLRRLKRKEWTAVSAALDPAKLSDALPLMLLVGKARLDRPRKARLAALRKELASETPPAVDLLTLLRLREVLGLKRTGALIDQLADARTPAVTQMLAASRALLTALKGPRRSARALGPKVLPIDGEVLVRFTYKPEGFQKVVYLCGDWDGWKETAHPMTRLPDGHFELTLRLPRGRHQYKFRMGDDDEHWYLDPQNPVIVPNGMGGENSAIDLR